MGNRYLKTEIAALTAMYPTAAKADIMEALPGRGWSAISKYAQRTLGLQRSKKAKLKASPEGRVNAELLKK